MSNSSIQSESPAASDPSSNRSSFSNPFADQIEPEVETPNKRLEEARKSMKLSDYELLNCVVCCEALCPPLFQCVNGHEVCSKCFPKRKKCSLCNSESRGARNFTLEKFIEAMVMPCPNKGHGCLEVFPYYKEEQHMQDCPFTPTCCPEVNCRFFSYPHYAVIQHGIQQHGWAIMKLKIGEPAPFLISEMTPFKFFTDEKERAYLAIMDYTEKTMKFAMVLVEGAQSCELPSLRYELSIRQHEIGETDCKPVTMTGPVLRSRLHEKIEIPDIPVVFNTKKISPIIGVTVIEGQEDLCSHQ